MSPCQVRGAIILCGGRSARMGRDKALLPFGPNETLLQRVVRIVSRAVPAERVVCVAAAEQQVPTLPVGVRVVRDDVPNLGPLAGLALGLTALEGEADAVLVCGCDAPLLRLPFVERLFELLGAQQIAVPCDGEQLHPLPAIYRVDVLPTIRSLLNRGERSLQSVVAVGNARRVNLAELRGVDPDLNSLLQCNTAEEYERALVFAQLSTDKSP